MSTSTVEVDDTDTGSANSDDSLDPDPDPCVYEEFFDCDDDHSIWAMISTMQMMVVIFHRL